MFYSVIQFIKLLDAHRHLIGRSCNILSIPEGYPTRMSGISMDVRNMSPLSESGYTVDVSRNDVCYVGWFLSTQRIEKILAEEFFVFVVNCEKNIVSIYYWQQVFFLFSANIYIYKYIKGPSVKDVMHFESFVIPFSK